MLSVLDVIKDATAVSVDVDVIKHIYAAVYYCQSRNYTHRLHAAACGVRLYAASDVAYGRSIFYNIEPYARSI